MLAARPMTTAFLLNNERCLMMKPSKDRSFKPGIWAGVGGHIEEGEIRNPLGSCLREIEEEAGLCESDVESLSLRYIVHRLSSVDSEIRQQYVYFGNARRTDVLQTDEGQLHWIGLSSLLDLETARTTKFIFEHYFDEGSATSDVYVGAVFKAHGDPRMSWSPLQDWE